MPFIKSINVLVIMRSWKSILTLMFLATLCMLHHGRLIFLIAELLLFHSSGMGCCVGSLIVSIFRDKQPWIVNLKALLSFEYSYIFTRRFTVTWQKILIFELHHIHTNVWIWNTSGRDSKDCCTESEQSIPLRCVAPRRHIPRQVPNSTQPVLQ